MRGRQAWEGYRFLDHVTDAFIEAWGTTFERALAQAGLGFFDTMIDAGKVRPVLTQEIEVQGHDELELVYNWLEELLLSFEIRRTAFGKFDIDPVRKAGKSLEVRAIAKGELYDPARHGSKVEVKGVTYHMMEIRREAGLVKLQYLLDL